MRGYIANTDWEWFRFLRDRPHLEELNFWFPSPIRLPRLAAGTPFFFRLKAPRRAIGGFGVVSRVERLPDWLAWDCFGEGNGASSLFDLRERIGRYTKRAVHPRSGREIGCVVLSAPVFLSEERWVEPPREWRDTIVRGKSLDLSSGEGARLLEQTERAAREEAAARGAAGGEISELIERWGEGSLVKPRPGQGTFRLSVIEAYGKACAVTREHSLPALEAAHIQPYAERPSYEVRNGILLRADVHHLFDRGYVTVTEDYEFRVSPRLYREFRNGRSYRPFDGHRIFVPEDPDKRPDRERLRHHSVRIFLG